MIFCVRIEIDIAWCEAFHTNEDHNIKAMLKTEINNSLKV